MIKTRFAPSPTGALHLGGARTALFNWLYARNQKGKFVLRMEDTDKERSTQESVDEILESLKWLGLDIDEGPYYQSERTEVYKEKVEKLLADGKAYRCYCTKEELDAARQAMQKAGKKPMYNRKCRDKDGDQSKPHVIRFKMPIEGGTVFHDTLRGDVKTKNEELDDLIIRRTDGNVTYNLVVVVDDAEMGITDIVRGDYHIANTPKQLNLYKALGYSPPNFTHVSLILGNNKKRLSKRDGSGSVLSLRNKGFLPSAVVNMLARLGWGYGDEEVFTVDGLIGKFSLRNLTLSPAVFNDEKLAWLNVQHIKLMDNEKLAEAAMPFVKAKHQNATREDMLKLIPMLKERSRTLVELASGTDFFFAESVVFDEKAKAKFITKETKPALKEAIKLIEELGVTDSEKLNEAFKASAEKLSIKMKAMAQPVRVALTGKTVSPGIFEMMSALGKEESLKRIGMASSL